MDAFKINILPVPTEIRLDSVYAIFGDYYLSKSDILINCGFNTSAGCPGDAIDQALIGRKPGVQDTVLPSSMFRETHRRKVQVQLSVKHFFQTRHFSCILFTRPCHRVLVRLTSSV